MNSVALSSSGGNRQADDVSNHPEERELDPWDVDVAESVEVEILENMRYVKAPPQIINQQLSQMVYI